MGNVFVALVLAYEISIAVKRVCERERIFALVRQAQPRAYIAPRMSSGPRSPAAGSGELNFLRRFTSHSHNPLPLAVVLQIRDVRCLCRWSYQCRCSGHIGQVVLDVVDFLVYALVE